MRYRNSKVMIICFLIFSVFGCYKINADEVRVVEEATIESTREVTSAGTYFITSAMNEEKGIQHLKKVRIHVKYPKTVLDYDNNEGIDAHDIVAHPDTFEKMNEQELIHEGGAHAWSMIDGTQIPIVKVKKENATSPYAIKDVVYQTGKDTSVNVSVYTQEEIPLGFDEVYINYTTLFSSNYLLLSLLVLFLTVLPIIIYTCMFIYLETKNKEVSNLLFKN